MLHKLKGASDGKFINSNEVYNNTLFLKIEDLNFLELDVSKLSAAIAADKILEHVKKI